MSRLRRILVAEGLMKTASRGEVVQWAREGNRVKVNGKTLWGGLGNRAGLHGYARELISEKWKKSGPRFEKKVDALPPGTEVELFYFKNTTRDRGRWVKSRTVVMPEAQAMPGPLLREATEALEALYQNRVRVSDTSLVGGTTWSLTLSNGSQYHWDSKYPGELYDVRADEYYSAW
jgi:hypothetical protein